MQKKLLQAYLINTHEIGIVYLSEDNDIDEMDFSLEVEGKKRPLKKQINRRGSFMEVRLLSEEAILLGKDYRVVSAEEEFADLDYDSYVTSHEFDELYTYSGGDLGAKYSKEKTSFKFWSPLASKVYLKLEKGENSFLAYEMKRSEHGVYHIDIKGDLFNKKYAYLVRINGREKQIRDPYEASTSLNSEYSAVIDLELVKSLGTVPCKTKFEQYVDAVIYELDVRDFTEQTDLENKGTYLGILDKVDYLKKLGITHVQLLPVLDFANVDDLVKDTYNWGYDPISWFALEGSYSITPEDPMSKMIEFKTLVNELHKNGIRVILDVVYNHIYDYVNSEFQKNVPYYYFRKKKNRMSNASGCGNDIASERKMVRKIILDSISFLIDTYDIDGFRFDLMGLIDIDTTKQIVKIAKSKKKDIMIYGEGWHMDTVLQDNKKSSMLNARQIPEVAFFNDTFRDLIKGPTFNSGATGFISGNIEHKTAVEQVFLGSVLNGKFDDANQSLNYVECHDNQTLYDKLATIYDNEEDILRMVKFANAITVLSLGIPLIHMGQEIGLSKFGLDNTYNVKDVNNMDWELVEERMDMVNYLSGLINFRKKYKAFSLTKPSQMLATFDCFWLENGILTIAIRNKEFLEESEKVLFVVNASNEAKQVDFDDYFTLLLSSAGVLEKEKKYKIMNLICPPSTVNIFELIK